MGFTCCAVGCHNRQGKNKGVSFYRFPTDRERREKWVAAVKRESWQPTPYSRVCSDHFVSGEKSNNPLSPDFVPTIFAYCGSPHKQKQKKHLEQFERRQSLKQRRRDEENRNVAVNALLDLSAPPSDLRPSESPSNCEPEVQQDPGPAESCQTRHFGNIVGTQTNLCMSDIVAMEKDLNNVRNDLIQTKLQPKQSEVLQLCSFEGNDDKVRTFTGLPSFAVFLALFRVINTSLKDNPTLTAFQQFLLTCMRLRLNLTVQFLAYMFGVSASTVSRVFTNVISIMNARLVPLLVIWPEREQLRKTLPMAFRKSFRKCACIIDCFEVFIEQPKDLMARAQTYSSYKSHNTMKYMIAITPHGVISFISKGWGGGGGRTSDVHITGNSQFLDKLLPGDLVLADRGFDVHDQVGLYCAELSIPAFTKGRKQLSSHELEKTRGLAAVRIHVERVIGVTH